MAATGSIQIDFDLVLNAGTLLAVVIGLLRIGRQYGTHESRFKQLEEAAKKLQEDHSKMVTKEELATQLQAIQQMLKFILDNVRK